MCGFSFNFGIVGGGILWLIFMAQRVMFWETRILCIIGTKDIVIAFRSIDQS